VYENRRNKAEQPSGTRYFRPISWWNGWFWGWKEKPGLFVLL